MRTYSGYWNSDKKKPARTRLPVLPLAVAALVFFLIILLRGSDSPLPQRNAGDDGAMRFYYGTADGEAFSLHGADITFPADQDIIKSLETGFKQPPYGSRFIQAIGNDVYINRIMLIDDAVQIDFNIIPTPAGYSNNEAAAAINAIAATLFEIYDAVSVIITVEGRHYHTIDLGRHLLKTL
ncbi:MAG: hypothetical protein FWE91_04925 [Defluviitaleaceae bacterium]|nr:hypothetical protein [Defluviitaleaceae bacterium]MCL2837157.1 hypothetical protein [Defluviitaleaceae bacterium]